MSADRDPFRAAVSAIDAGDADTLGALLDAHPELATERLDGTPDWLWQEVSGAADLYAHGTPLHHAVCSGSLDTVKVLVEAGADLSRPDTAWQATPLGWAEHYVENARPDRQPGYEAIASYLRSLG